MVSSPADADLVFEISWAFSTGPDILGRLRLVILDPKTHITLWTMSEAVRGATLLSNRDKNFDQAMTALLGRLNVLAAPAPPGGAAPN